MYLGCCADEMRAFLRQLKTGPPSAWDSASASLKMFCHDPAHAAPPSSLLCCSPWTRRCLSTSSLGCRHETIQWLAKARSTCTHDAHGQEPCSVLTHLDAHPGPNRSPTSDRRLRGPTETLRGGRQWRRVATLVESTAGDRTG